MIVLDYNVKKCGQKLYWFMIILLSLLIIGVTVPFIFLILKNLDNLIAVIVNALIAIVFDSFLLFVIFSLRNPELIIYDSRVEYINVFNKKKIVHGVLSDMTFKGNYGFGIRITNNKTNEIIRTYTLCKSIYMIREFEKANIELK